MSVYQLRFKSVMVPRNGNQLKTVPSVLALASNMRIAVLKKVATVIKLIIAAVCSVSVWKPI